MPRLKTYDLFMSHAWKYNADYYKLERLLNSASNFYYRNYSVPAHNPKVDPNTIIGKKMLEMELDKQVRPVNCVLILSGMYAAYSEWIEKEIGIAKRYNKPIIGVRPRSQIRIPRIVSDSAIEMVNWNTDSIVNAIRRNSI